MAPTKNLRKNNRVKSKKRPIPKNNKRKTNKSKKRTSRNKRRTRRKQKGGMPTSVKLGKPKSRFSLGWLRKHPRSGTYTVLQGPVAQEQVSQGPILPLPPFYMKQHIKNHKKKKGVIRVNKAVLGNKSFNNIIKEGQELNKKYWNDQGVNN